MEGDDFTYDTASQRASAYFERYNKILHGPESPPELLALVLNHVRKAVKVLAIRSLEVTCLDNFEDKLWDAHSGLEQRFRAAFLSQNTRGKRDLVLARRYCSFIRDSQGYYREHIRLLDQRYGLQEVRAIDQDPLVQRDELYDDGYSLRNCVRRSYCAALIALGDLSRWRGQLLPEEAADWKPARACYYSAGSVNPLSHVHHAKIALTYSNENDHFNALYHMYRSYSNLKDEEAMTIHVRREMVKIAQANQDECLESRVSCHQPSKNVVPLIANFLRVHCVYFLKEEPGPAHSELEKIFFDLWRTFMRSDDCQELGGAVAAKMAVMNIVAQVANPDFIYHNFKSCTILFNALSDELKNQKQGLFNVRHFPNSLAERLPARAHFLLPPIRIYSLWLVKYG